MDTETRAYLKDLASACQDTLGSALTGLYVQGSIAQNNYNREKSDIDIIGVVKAPLNAALKTKLGSRSTHAQLPVPATGMDLVLLTEDTVKDPTPEPEYDFWFATGQTWDTEINNGGTSREMLIYQETCRVSGLPLYGPSAETVFSPVPRALLLQALIDVLTWHRKTIGDTFHDPAGQYAILNACRAWHYAAKNALISKSAGAEWVLAQEPQHHLAAKALKMRQGQEFTHVAHEEVDDFLVKVISALEEKITHPATTGQS